MKRFYLDTNIYSYLCNPDHDLFKISGKLKTLARHRFIEIFGSLEILEEFLPRQKSDQNHYIRMVDLFWELCGIRVLNYWNSLIRCEVNKGARLSVKEAFLPEDILRVVHNNSYNTNMDDNYAVEVQKRKSEYEAVRRSLVKEIFSIAKKEWGLDDFRENISNMVINRKLVSNWGRGLLSQDATRYGLNKDENTWPDISILPCTRSFISINLAWVRKNYVNLRKDKGADFYDSMHYVLATMVGYFTTSDKVLRSTVDLIGWKPTTTIDVTRFSDVIKSL